MHTQQISKRLPLKDIIDHPINSSIYRDNFDDDLVESIKENGVLSPIVVCKHPGGSYVCLSGHRRRQAAGVAGLTEIPCLIYRDEVPEWQQVLMVIESNRQRVKTTETLARETDQLAKIKEQQAKDRKASKLQKGQKKAPEPVPENFTERGEALDLAAEETGIGSRPTAKKAIAVTAHIDKLTAEGLTEEAEILREVLNRSVSAAHRIVTGKDPFPWPDEERTDAEEMSETETVESEPDTDISNVLDHYKKPVHRDFADAFLCRVAYREVLNQLTALTKSVKALGNSPGGAWLHKSEADSLIKDLRRCIDFGQPHTECGMCQRDPVKRATCDGCKHRGYVNEMAYGNQTADAKKWIESR